MAIGKVFKILSIAILAIMLLTSCGAPDPQEIADSLLIYFNSGAFQKGNQIKAGSGLSVSVINRSGYCLIFPYDYGVKKIYLQRNGEELEISNTVDYIFLEDAPTVDKIDIDSSGSVLLAPDLTNIVIDAPQEFRATITGHLCDDETVEITKDIIFFVVP